MDNKITKERLTSFFQYEWIKVTAIALILCFFVFLGFTWLGNANRILTKGQQFNLYYSAKCGGNNSTMENMRKLLDKTLSFDVQSVTVSDLDETFGRQQLETWTVAGDVDMYVCSTDLISGSTYSDFTYLVENYDVFDLEKFYTGAKFYAEGFLISRNAEFLPENISDEAVKESFDIRLSSDNRFRTEKSKAEGLLLERERIEKLVYAVNRFEKLLSEDIFAEVEVEGESRKYGVDFSKLHTVEGKKSASEYGKLREAENAENTVIIVFDNSDRQPELMYESLSVLVGLVENTTGLLD